MENYKQNKNGLLKTVQAQLIPKQPSDFFKKIVLMASQKAGVLKILTKEQLHPASTLRT